MLLYPSQPEDHVVQAVVAAFVQGEDVQPVAEGNKNDAVPRVFAAVAVGQFAHGAGLEAAAVDEDEDRLPLRFFCGHDVQCHGRFVKTVRAVRAEFPVIEGIRPRGFVPEGKILPAVDGEIRRVQFVPCRHGRGQFKTFCHGIRDAPEEVHAVLLGSGNAAADRLDRDETHVRLLADNKKGKDKPSPLMFTVRSAKARIRRCVYWSRRRNGGRRSSYSRCSQCTLPDRYKTQSNA